jgi:diguanylate cyclase (GGDEF)-like protein
MSFFSYGEEKNFYVFAEEIVSYTGGDKLKKIINQFDEIKTKNDNNKQYIPETKKSIDLIYKIIEISHYFSQSKHLPFFMKKMKDISIKNENYGLEYYYGTAMYVYEEIDKSEELSEKHYKTAIKYAILNKNNSFLYTMYSDFALYYIYKNDYVMAMKNIISLEKYINNNFQKISFLELKYIYYFTLNNFKESLEMLKKEEFMLANTNINFKSNEIKNNTIIYLYFHLSLVYSKIEDYDNATIYAEKIVKFTTDVNDPYSMVQGYTALVYAKLNKNLLEESEYILLKLKKLMIEHKLEKEAALNYNIGMMQILYYEKTNQPKKLMKYIIDFKKFVELNDPHGMPKLIAKLSNAYTLNDNFNTALKYKKIEIKNLENQFTDKLINMSSLINKEVDNNILQKDRKKLSQGMIEQDKKMHSNHLKENLMIKNFYITCFSFFLLFSLIIILFMLYVKNKKLSYTDYLTLLPNRRYIKEKIIKEINKENDIGLILFDLDFFKKINDTYGHDSGDAVLKEMTKIIYSITRKNDIVSRIGGEEFLILINNNKKLPYEIAERLRKKIEEHDFSFINNELKVTASFGIGTNKTINNYENIFQEADENLYIAKNNGRNKVV